MVIANADCNTEFYSEFMRVELLLWVNFCRVKFPQARPGYIQIRT